MPTKPLSIQDLFHGCDPAQFAFKTTAELEPLDEILGQPRAIEAVKFGIDIKHKGYNIFALGPPGTGKRSLVRQYLSKRAPEEPTPDDWCYVNNFELPHKPIALRLPPGKGPEFRYDMEQLLEDVLRALPHAFESSEYRKRRESLEAEMFREQQDELEAIHEEAEKANLKVVWSPAGFVFNPTRDGEPLSPDQIDALPEKDRDALQNKAGELQDKILEIMRKAPRAQREARQKLNEMNREVALQAFKPLVDELQNKYKEWPEACAHLDAVEKDLMDNAERLLELQRGDHPQSLPNQTIAAMLESSLLRPYQVNVIVCNEPSHGAPVIYEENPSYQNILGRTENLAQMGTLVTDFTLIKPGRLHEANGGYLILDATKVLTSLYVWDVLKRALHSREIRIEPMGLALGLMSTVSLEPQPIPLDVKVVLLGTRLLYYLLREYDPDFAELIKVPADFETDMDRGEKEHLLYARLVATLAQSAELRPFTAEAVARVIEYGSRAAGDAHKVSIHIRSVSDILLEADHWAHTNGNGAVTADDVDRAVRGQLYRASRMYERNLEMLKRGVLLIDTTGEQIGQVNGLAVYPFGDFFFGGPHRITARTRLGDGNVLDIEREVELGQPIHSKGVLILQGFLGGRYARDVPLSLSASLVFEQSYGEVEGDSASSAELYALLSAIGEVPVRQSLAVTGSVNQHGEVQAIGGVNEKIEGFFDVCKRAGLTGEQGVLIPVSNVQHLMLRRDIVEAAENGEFHIYPVTTIDEGIELLTGVPAGAPDAEGNYPPDSVNGKVSARLSESAEARKKFGEEPEPGRGKDA